MRSIFSPALRQKILHLEFMNLVKIHEDNICERLRGEEPFPVWQKQTVICR